MHLAKGRLGAFTQSLQARQSGFVLPFIQESRGGVAMPAVGMFEGRDQLACGRLAQARQLRLFEAVRDDAVDAPAIIAAVQIQVLLDRLRNGPRMLDHLPVHIGDIERAVWRVGELNRAKPGVR